MSDAGAGIQSQSRTGRQRCCEWPVPIWCGWFIPLYVFACDISCRYKIIHPSTLVLLTLFWNRLVFLAELKLDRAWLWPVGTWNSGRRDVPWDVLAFLSRARAGSHLPPATACGSFQARAFCPFLLRFPIRFSLPSRRNPQRANIATECKVASITCPASRHTQRNQ